MKLLIIVSLLSLLSYQSTHAQDTLITRTITRVIAPNIYYQDTFAFRVPLPKPIVITKTEYRDTGAIRVNLLTQQLSILQYKIAVQDSTIADLISQLNSSKPTPDQIHFQPTHFSTYMKWDPVPGANFYTVMRDGKMLTELTGTDTWDAMLDPNTTYEYIVIPWDTLGKNYPMLRGRVNTLANGQTISIAGEGNLYNSLKDALEQPLVTTINITGWIAGPPLSINHTRLLISGQLRFGIDGQPTQQFLTHSKGVLGLKGTFLGPNSRPVRVGMQRPDVIMYRRDINSADNCELHMQGTFGDSLDWQNGWVNIARNVRGRATSGKDVIAMYNSTISAGEAFELRPYSGYIDGDKKGVVTPDHGKRFLARNIRVIGSAFQKNGSVATGTIARFSDSTALISVDSAQYPGHNFYEFGTWSRTAQFVIFKEPATPPGALNRFENSSIRPVWRVRSRYQAEVPLAYTYPPDPSQFARPITPGHIKLFNTPNMQPPIPWEGHFLYSHSACELEVYNAHLRGMFSLFIRQSDAPEYRGPGFRQLSLSNVTFEAPTDTRFDYIKEFGGYVQMKDFPKSGPPIELDMPGPVGPALIQNVKVMIRRANIKAYIK